MSDNNGWPGKPGVPLNPEWDGAHRLRHLESGLERDALWACGGTWLDVDGSFSIPHAAAFYAYLGPFLTAAEVDARVKEARRDALEEAAREIDCGCDIRAAVLERLKSQGERRARWLCPKGDDCCALQSAAIRALKGEGPASAPAATGKHVEQLGNGARLTTLGQPVGKGEGDD
jgi:hypothetical protein